MKRVLLTVSSGITALATLLLVGGSAFAWTYSMTGTGACQTNGTFEITWTVNNTVETEPLTITSTSNPSVVPVGTIIAGDSSQSFMQNAPGTSATSYTLSLEGNFPGDQTQRTATATVDLDAACTQPVVVPPVQTGATGVLGASTTTPVAPTPTPAAPKVAPVGSVNAGTGDARSLDVVAAVGLIGSAGLAIFGVRRLGKSQS